MYFSQTLYFLILATVLSIVALATSNWGCGGNIITECIGKTKTEKMLHLTAKSLMIIGVGLLILAIVMEIVTCCLDDGKRSQHVRSFGICRGVASILALCTLLAGMLIVTHLIGDIFSYMAMVMAVGFVIHCNTLVVQTIKCADH